MPWKRVVTYPGAGLDAHFKAFLDNLVSRGIGFVVRFFVLIGFLLMAALTLIYNVLLLIAWPLVPLAAAAALIKGLMP